MHRQNLLTLLAPGDPTILADSSAQATPWSGCVWLCSLPRSLFTLWLSPLLALQHESQWQYLCIKCIWVKRMLNSRVTQLRSKLLSPHKLCIFGKIIEWITLCMEFIALWGLKLGNPLITFLKHKKCFVTYMQDSENNSPIVVMVHFPYYNR